MSSFDKPLTNILEKYRPEFEEHIFNIPENSLMGMMLREGRFDTWRREIADKRMAFHHPYRWRLERVRRRLRGHRFMLKLKLDKARERLAHKLAPWTMYPDDD